MVQYLIGGAFLQFSRKLGRTFRDNARNMKKIGWRINEPQRSLINAARNIEKVAFEVVMVVAFFNSLSFNNNISKAFWKKLWWQIVQNCKKCSIFKLGIEISVPNYCQCCPMVIESSIFKSWMKHYQLSLRNCVARRVDTTHFKMQSLCEIPNQGPRA